MEKSESAVAKLAQAAQATDNTENDESELPKVFDRTHLDDPRFEDYSKLLKPRPGADFSRVFPPKICSWAPCGTYPSPFKSNPERFNLGLSFVSDEETVLVDIIGHVTQPTASREFLRAGPREFISFHPKSVKAAIVTCGGLCPGINSVVREIYNTLHHLYGVEEIYGIPFGYRGFYSPDLEYIRLTDHNVSSIHHQGGSYLGSSRGGFDLKKIVDAIEDNNFNQVYIIGGDGTQRGALKIHDEVVRRKLKVSVVGIPKTIDNDIALIDKSFGFDTAVEEAQRAIRSAVVESKSAQNGIGLVKLMGRSSGYIAMYATLASHDVDICLIPEVSFILEGSCGLLEYIRSLLKRKGHCVIVVAEGAGMDLLKDEVDMSKRDASGNIKMPDIGLFLKDRIIAWFTEQVRMEITLKYIDPTYMIRSIPANASDCLMCGLLAQSAVHSAMAGRGGFTIGVINTQYSIIPMHELSSRGRIKVDVNSRMWHRVLATTEQPDFRA
ncbi:hypothetical protein GAYE_SCF16G3659 [Galdieria yellowstonensis]|uniref:Phosphofructokinase domain-containing protein n=1 Tax=Galdieria yellowstonensis TaxID=3028027 RepID=A0AAV9IE44_9RHOD|nr:hypothetical protein GAYE_SCF16G3659 [Galdieria yellowstonensis]